MSIPSHTIGFDLLLNTHASLVGVLSLPFEAAANNTWKLFCQHYIISDSDTHTHSPSLTSSLDFLYAHVDHHGPLGVVGLH